MANVLFLLTITHIAVSTSQCSVEHCQAGAVDGIHDVQDVADNAWCNNKTESKPQHTCGNI